MATKQSIQNLGAGLGDLLSILAAKYQYDKARQSVMPGLQGGNLNQIAQGSPMDAINTDIQFPQQPDEAAVLSAMIRSNPQLFKMNPFVQGAAQGLEAMAPKFEQLNPAYNTVQRGPFGQVGEKTPGIPAVSSTTQLRDVKNPDGSTKFYTKDGITFKVQERYNPATNEAIPNSQVDVKVDDTTRVDPNLFSIRMSIVDKFNANPQVNKALQMATSANTIIRLLEEGNPVADQSIPTFMARASGEVGNLSEADKAPFGGSRALVEQMSAIIQKASTGQLTPENREFVKQVASVFMRSANQNITSIAKRNAKQYSRASGIPEGEILDLIYPSELDFGGGQNSGTIIGSKEGFDKWLRNRSR